MSLILESKRIEPQRHKEHKVKKKEERIHQNF